MVSRVWGDLGPGARLGESAGPRHWARRSGRGGGPQAPVDVRRDWLSAAHVHPGDHSAAGESQVHHAAADRSAGRRDRLRPRVAEVAAAHGVAWWTVQATVNAAAVLLPDVDELHVRRLGVDEHRYRRVRWFR